MIVENGFGAGGIGLREEVEDLVEAAADQVETAEGEGGPRAIPDEPFEARAVGGFDAGAGESSPCREGFI